MKALSIIIAAALLAPCSYAAEASAEVEQAEAALLPEAQMRARRVAAPQPQYPAEVRRWGGGGSGVAEIRVDPSGKVVAARMHQSTGIAELDTAALAAFRQWQFTPGEAFVYRAPIAFEMEPLKAAPVGIPERTVAQQTVTTRATPPPKQVQRVQQKPAPRATPKPRIGDISNPEAEQPPFVGMTQAQALARYGKPKHRSITDEGEQWNYLLNFGEVMGKAMIPFNFKPPTIRVGVLVFDATGKVKKFRWDADTSG